MAILFFNEKAEHQQLLDALQQHLPNEQLVEWPYSGDLSSITTAIAWNPPPSFFDGLDKLQQVLSPAAGVEKLLAHPGLRENVKVVRLADAGMGEPMAEYVLYGVLHAQRSMQAFRMAQQACKWDEHTQAHSATQFNVGILGAGQLGMAAAKKLLMNGYNVSNWSRSPKKMSGVSNFSGKTQLSAFFEELNVVVCLLPLTPETHCILNSDTFSQMPKGAYLINPGRGGHLDESALLQALDSEQLSGAMLDVFQEEPLPHSHPFWAHSKITVTPHISAPTPIMGAAKQMTESLALLNAGERPVGLVDRGRGY